MEKYTHKEYVKRMINMMETEISKQTRYTNFSTTTKFNNFWMRYNLPYEAIKLENGNILFVNRGYKPLFYFSEGFSEIVNYEDFIDMSFKSAKDSQYFYTDSTKPWDSKNNLINYMDKMKNFLSE